MFGYFSMNISHITVLAEMYNSLFTSPGFTWYCSPSQTELENLMVDWVADLYNLPGIFYNKSQGGGYMVNTTSDAYF